MDILLITMPFGPLQQPAIGLSLLKASVPERSTRLLYATITFADLIGADLYGWIGGASASTALVGEWLFAPALFGHDQRPASEYEQQVLATEEHIDPYTDEIREGLRHARTLVEPFIERLVADVVAVNPTIVGFSNVFAQQVASLALAKRLKAALPETTLLFGGANCEAPMGPALVKQFPFIDAVVSGEGEPVFPVLVDRILTGQAITDLPGVHTAAYTNATPLTERVAGMDDLPIPDYGDFFEQWEPGAVARGRSPIVLFETSRGCWWGQSQHCTFCGLNGSSMTFRSKSATRAIDEIEELARRHPGYFMMAVDNILDHRYFRDLIPELGRRPEHRLFYALKANLKKDQLRLLHDAGVKTIQPGIESLSDTVLKTMRKGETALENIQLLKWCRELDLKPAWNFIWGFPGEPPLEYERMARMVPWLSHLKPPQSFRRIRLDRYSPLVDQAEQFGLEHLRPSEAYAYVYPFDEATLAQLAYHFEFDYRVPQDVAAYTGPLVTALTAWQHDHESSALASEDRGDELWIWDLRPSAVEALTTLDGAARDVYLACDRVQAMTRLVDGGAEGLACSRDELETLVAPLIANGLMLRHQDRLLSLAVPAPTTTGQ